MKTWKYIYNGETISVENKVMSCKLFINDKLADKKDGLECDAELLGKLNHGEKVRAVLGGVLEVQCKLYIDDVIQTPVAE